LANCSCVSEGKPVFSSYPESGEKSDSDPRLQILMLVHQAVGRMDEATVSGNVSSDADTVNAPVQHRSDTLTAP
jgi:hypothetical protein